MISEYFKLAIKNFKKRKLRSWLTMLGIFISIATIFILISLSLGLQGAVKEQFRILGTDKFFIQSKTGFLGPPGSVGGDILTEKDIKVLSKIQGIKDYSYFVAGNAKVELKGEIRYFMIWGIPPDKTEVYTEIGSFKIEDGRMLKSDDKDSIILGNLHKTGNLWSSSVKSGSKLFINDKEFTTKGILELIGNPDDDRMIMMDLDSFRTLFNISERVDYIMIQINSYENVVDVAQKVEKKLRNSRGQTEKTQDFSILTPDELLKSFQTILKMVTFFLAGIAAISLLVGGIGIANTMYTSVLERTKEIGIMKAIGAKNSDILWIFLIESGLLGLVGGIIGVVLGMIVSKSIEIIAVNQLNTNLLQTSFPLWLVAGCLVFSFCIGAVSGTLPALQASKIKVVDAIRYE